MSNQILNRNVNFRFVIKTATSKISESIGNSRFSASKSRDISHMIPREAINARSLRETFRVVPDKRVLRHTWNTLEGVRGETCSTPTGTFIFASKIPHNRTRTRMRTRTAYKSSGWLRALGMRPINGYMQISSKH